MAAALPAKLKIPSIAPFATRAAQLEKFRPIVSYWCNYHIIQEILGKNLHASDDDCRDYTMALMDKLEAAKNQSPPVDAIVDDIAAKAYVEQFALETFQKGDDAIHTDRASRATIDTFQAASTFLELLTVWEKPLDPETTSKIKYAKYHALRIAKAIKAGEDPNASNPKDDVPALPTSGEDMQGDGAQLPVNGAGYRAPFVESVSDSMSPSRTGSVPAGGQGFAAPPPPQPVREEPDVSPIEPENGPSSRDGSVGGGYFPAAPPSTTDNVASTIPTANPQLDPGNPVPGSSDVAGRAPSTLDGQSLPRSYSSQATPSAPLPPQTPQTFIPPTAPVPQQAPFPRQPPAPSAPLATGHHLGPVTYRNDDESVAQAQKHAKWAISALNFEDVPTAVKELRIALQHLGAS